MTVGTRERLWPFGKPGSFKVTPLAAFSYFALAVWATVALRPREVFCRNVPDDRLLPLCKAIVHIQVDIVVEKFPTEAIGLYSADQDGAAPEAELFVCPKATRALGLPPGSLGIGARVGGALKLLMMRDPDDSHDET